MIYQSFLLKLVGLEFEEAKKRCSHRGLKIFPLKNGMAVSEVVRPKTVMLWLDDENKVLRAGPSDALELLKD